MSEKAVSAVTSCRFQGPRRFGHARGLVLDYVPGDRGNVVAVLEGPERSGRTVLYAFPRTMAVLWATGHCLAVSVATVLLDVIRLSNRFAGRSRYAARCALVPGRARCEHRISRRRLLARLRRRIQRGRRTDSGAGLTLPSEGEEQKSPPCRSGVSPPQA